MVIPLEGRLAISILWPLIMYWVVYSLLWRRRASIRHVLISMGWGAVAFGLIFGIDSQLGGGPEATRLLFRFWIPILETIVGSGYLLWLLARRQIPDYVAGAAYGTAALGSIAILDNVFYTLVGGNVSQGLLFSVIRVFTVGNIYAVSGAMVGFGMGMVRFERRTGARALWVLGSLVTAMIWRAVYNNLVTSLTGTDLFLDAIIFAVGGIGLMVAVMRSTQSRHALQALQSEKKRADDLITMVIPLGVSLSAERDFTRMLDTIVEQARRFSNADGGTLYLRTADEQLEAVVISNQSLGIFAQGQGARDMVVEPLMLFDEQGRPNDHSIAAAVVHKGETLNIPDVYAPSVEFRGPREFDRRTGYHTTSCLCLPLKNETGKAIGALQLVNARSPLTLDAGPFEAATQQGLESLSALASAALTSYIRTETLRREVQEFNIDQEKVAKHVAEITDSEFFNTLRDRVKKMGDRKTQPAAAAAS